MRSRSRGSFTNPTYAIPIKEYTYASNPCAAGQTFAWFDRAPGVGQDFVGERQTMADEVTKDFRKRVANGEVIFNRMSSTKATLSPATLSGHLLYKEDYWSCGSTSPYRYQKQYDMGAAVLLQFLNAGLEPDWVNQSISLPSLITGTEMSKALDEACTKLLGKRGIPDANIWESIAERHQSYKLLASYLSETEKSVNAILKAIYSRPKRTAGRSLQAGVRNSRNIAEAAFATELITRYGLLPLLGDVHSIIAGWKKSTGKVRQTVRATSVVGRSGSSTSVYSYGSNDFIFNRLTSDEFKVRAMSLDEWYVTEFENLGLSTKGLMGLPWELTRLSFVADWFANFGEFMYANMPTPGITQLGSCWVSTRIRALTVSSVAVVPHGIAVVLSSPSGAKTGTIIEKTRIPGLQAPTIVIRNRFGLDPSVEKNHLRIADAASLLGQRLSKLSRFFF